MIIRKLGHHRRFSLLAGVSAVVLALLVTVSGGEQPSSRPPVPGGPQGSEYLRRRAEWFARQRAFPLQHIPGGMRLKALRQLDEMIERGQVSDPSAWQFIGPQPTTWFGIGLGPTSGRVTAIAVVPGSPGTAYLGGGVGGVWKTTDGGATWTPLTDAQPSLSVGSIAFDPSNSSTIYVGTGEDDFGADNYYGAGILKSSDGGSTWTQFPGPFATPDGAAFFCGGAFIGALAVSPKNSLDILAGVSRLCEGPSNSGVFQSTDGGATWTHVLGGGAGNVVFFDTVSGNAYAGLGWPFAGGAAANGVYVSTDGGTTWTARNGTSPNTLPSGTSAGRIALAEFPGSTPTLYAGVSNASTSSSTLLGVFKSTDGGANWTKLMNAPAYCSPSGGSQQCWYDNVIAVNPKNASMVLLGGSGVDTRGSGTLFQSLDGGTTWSDITKDASGNFLHPDMHAIAFASDASVFYVGNDGGAYKTANVGMATPAWTNLNNSLGITQFYPNLSTFSNNLSLAFGGTQDNGTQSYAGALEWGNVLTCGDGGQTAINPTVTAAQIGIAYLGCAYIPPNTGVTFLWKLTLTSSTSGTFAPAQTGINASDRGAFIPPLAIDPSNPQNLYFGTDRVYQSKNSAGSWAVISPTLAGKATAIVVAPSSSNNVYAGSDQGEVWVTANALETGGATWTQVNTGTNGLPSREVTALAVDPKTPATAYAVFSGFSGFGDNLGHVFRTTDGGTSWTDMSGNLPNIPVNDIVVDPDIAGTFYAATDIGVFTTSDGGTTWTVLGTGLPRTVLLSLKLIEASRTLRAASHGRSAWDLSVPSTGPIVQLSPTSFAFGNQAVGTTSPAQPVTLTNNGAAPLTFNGFSMTGANPSDFSQTNNCPISPATLASGANCTINVTFTPTANGTRSAALSISDNAPTSPQTVSFSGTGVTPDYSLGSNPTSATVTAGATATYTLSVTPAGGFNQAVSLSCSGQPNLSTCTISPSSVTPSGGSAATATVTVATTAPTLTAPRGPFEILPSPHRHFPLEMVGLLAALAALGFALAGRKRRMALILVAAMLVTWAACGGGSSVTHSPGTPAGTYTITVTGTSGNLTHTVSLTLTVS